MPIVEEVDRCRELGQLSWLSSVGLAFFAWWVCVLKVWDVWVLDLPSPSECVLRGTHLWLFCGRDLERERRT